MEGIHICDRCEAAIAMLECTVCRQSDGVTRLALCQPCSSVIHLGKSRDHRIVVIEMKYADALIAEISDVAKQREDLCQYQKQLGEITKNLVERYNMNRNELCARVKKLKEDLSIVEQGLLKGLEDLYQEKKTYLVELMESCDTDLSQLSALLISSMKALSGEALSGEERDDIMKQLQDHKTKVCSRLASPLCNSSCGFCPSFTPVYDTLDSITSYYPWSLACGQRYDITEVGSLQCSGIFTALLSPDASTQNALNHISWAISTHLEEPSSSLPRPSLPHPLVPGQLCCAKYKGDLRWHRARIEKSTFESTQVMFLDYGNVEEVEPTELQSLDDKFLAYPFRVLDCHMVEEPLGLFEKREVRWKFKDLIAGRKLAVMLVKRLAMSGFLVQLLDVTSEEPFDIGVSVLTYARALGDTKLQQPIDLTSRDIRFKNQTPKPQLDSCTPKAVATIDIARSELKEVSIVEGLGTSSHASKTLMSLDLNTSVVNQVPKPSNTEVKPCLDSLALGLLHSAVHVGARLVVTVNSEIDKDGTFWVQAEPSDKQYQNMQQQIQTGGVVPLVCSPVLQGGHYLGLYSEDMQWYRARVEGVANDMYVVRYIDFGNYAILRDNVLADLGAQLRVLPAQAFKCSILTDKHPNLTDKELELFETSVPFEKPVMVEILHIDKDLIHVTLFLESSGRCVDILQTITSDVSTASSPGDQEEWTPGFSIGPADRNWADEMENLDSCGPQNLQLQQPGDHGYQKVKELVKEREVPNKPGQALNRMEEAPNQVPEDRETSTRTSRINKHAARKSILSNLRQTGHQRSRNTQKTATITAVNLPPPTSTTNLLNLVKLRVTNLPCQKSMEEVMAMFRAYGVVDECVSLDQTGGGAVCITMEAAGAKTAMEALSSSSSLRIEIVSGGKNWMPGGQNDGTEELLIRNFPTDLSRESLIELFAKYGTVHSLTFHSEDRSTAVITMDTIGAQQAFNNLCNITIGGKTMIVEKCQHT